MKFLIVEPFILFVRFPLGPKYSLFIWFSYSKFSLILYFLTGWMKYWIQDTMAHFLEYLNMKINHKSRLLCLLFLSTTYNMIVYTRFHVNSVCCVKDQTTLSAYLESTLSAYCASWERVLQHRRSSTL